MLFGVGLFIFAGENFVRLNHRAAPPSPTRATVIFAHLFINNLKVVDEKTATVILCKEIGQHRKLSLFLPFAHSVGLARCRHV